MFAVIKTGGKQYKVAAADVIAVATLAGEAGDPVAFGEVLMVGGENGVSLGSPLVQGATVAGEIVDHTRTRKILVFKKRRRKNSKRSHGHRQDLTLVRITEILTDGKEPAKAAKPAKKAETAETAEAAAPKPKRAKAKAPEAAEAATPETAKPARKPRAKAAKPAGESKE
jgi:large subunit ribosomal protein L21